MIAIKDLGLRLGTKVLLEHANLLINAGEKVSIVGRNGAGKSTLFALIRGELHEENGELEIPVFWRISQVEQHMPEVSVSATDFVLQGDQLLMGARERLELALAGENGMAIAQAYSDLGDAGDHDAAPRAQALIQGLGFKATDFDKPVNSFSGGWRMRLQLAKALMCPCDLLMLDEPTNHLDLDALIWLEAWLRKFDGTMLVISHDREFLDAVTSVTVHLEHAQLHRYNGGYSAFERLRAEKLEQQQAAHAKQQEKVQHLQKYIDRFRYKATKARQAQSRLKALERMERVAAVVADAEFSFEFKEPASLPNPMLAIDDVQFGYHTAGTSNLVLKGVRASILAGQRIGILGANGQGKSTFVKTIAQDLKPLSGEITIGKGLAVGYFAQQELDVLKVDETPLGHMMELARRVAASTGQVTREQELRNFLGTFNISGEMVTQRVGTLSGGEKARLVLCMIVWQRPNLLLLDEPTNHLDLATREALSLALNQFEGTVILVSHDRALLRSVCDEFWLVARGEVVPFEGDLEDYQQYLIEESKRVSKPPRAEQASAGINTKGQAAKATKPSQNHRLRIIDRELACNERRVDQLASAKDELERLLIDTSRDDLHELGRQLSSVVEEIRKLEDDWLLLEEEKEAIRAGV